MTQLKSHDFQQVYEELNISLDELGCVMLDLEPLENMGSVALALYHSPNKERFWINGWVCDKNPHITLLYGLVETGVKWENHIETVLKDWQIETVKIDHIDYFDSPYPDEPYYCLVAHIEVTEKLLEGHQRLEFLPHINTFAGYKPHMTIAYIDKNQGETYRDKMIANFNELWSGKSMEVKKTLNLGGNKS